MTDTEDAVEEQAMREARNEKKPTPAPLLRVIRAMVAVASRDASEPDDKE